VNGSVLIVEDDEIEDLNFLHQVEHIEADLAITRCKSLKSLAGLERLKHVGGSILIHDNALLTDITALKGIKTINGKISVTASPILVRFFFPRRNLHSRRAIGVHAFAPPVEALPCV
jgi:hypothetical protein